MDTLTKYPSSVTVNFFPHYLHPLLFVCLFVFFKVAVSWDFIYVVRTMRGMSYGTNKKWAH